MIFLDNRACAEQMLALTFCSFEWVLDHFRTAGISHIRLETIIKHRIEHTHTLALSQTDVIPLSLSVSLQALLQCHSCFNLLAQTHNLRAERERAGFIAYWISAWSPALAAVQWLQTESAPQHSHCSPSQTEGQRSHRPTATDCVQK